MTLIDLDWIDEGDGGWLCISMCVETKTVAVFKKEYEYFIIILCVRFLFFFFV